ncbi:hypothetical protein BN1723_014618 [Verticillium longisporum]|uniref:Uncharacterized protein n=1 Tax=Verticillium longisporum TaxID=100787 RepID=A0A0G4ME22_VERLO|nr:hypothetical protein BN1723_014618 [Verticillium longisporum]
MPTIPSHILVPMLTTGPDPAKKEPSHKQILDDEVANLRHRRQAPRTQDLLDRDVVAAGGGGGEARVEKDALGAAEVAGLGLLPAALGLVAGAAQDLVRVLALPEVAAVALVAGAGVAVGAEVVAEVAVALAGAVGPANVLAADVAHFVAAGAPRAHALDGEAHGLLDLRAQRDEGRLVADVHVGPGLGAGEARGAAAARGAARELGPAAAAAAAVQGARPVRRQRGARRCHGEAEQGRQEDERHEEGDGADAEEQENGAEDAVGLGPQAVLVLGQVDVVDLGVVAKGAADEGQARGEQAVVGEALVELVQDLGALLLLEHGAVEVVGRDLAAAAGAVDGQAPERAGVGVDAAVPALAEDGLGQRQLHAAEADHVPVGVALGKLLKGRLGEAAAALVQGVDGLGLLAVQHEGQAAVLVELRRAGAVFQRADELAVQLAVELGMSRCAQCRYDGPLAGGSPDDEGVVFGIAGRGGLAAGEEGRDGEAPGLGRQVEQGLACVEIGVVELGEHGVDGGEAPVMSTVLPSRRLVAAADAMVLVMVLLLLLLLLLCLKECVRGW